MTISDELLAAYVDGELDGAELARVEQAIARDKQLAQRVAQQRALRARLRSAFDGVLQEAVPQRLAQAARVRAHSGPAQVIDLARVRAERARRNNSPRSFNLRRYAVAATLVVGLALGALLQRISTPATLTEFRDGSLQARGALAQALNEQLASNPASAAQVHVGLTFKQHSGSYCRTFVLEATRPMAGLACREQDRWRILDLVSTDGSSAAVNGQNLRTASSSLPAALLQAVNERISGDPLSAPAEAKARGSGWH
ncbi:MAG TPA: zf-HC2 domain-containing protein [Steroidobacteraceae bacterium]|jgi:negative regulator of sigma E activity